MVERGGGGRGGGELSRIIKGEDAGGGHGGQKKTRTDKEIKVFDERE